MNNQLVDPQKAHSIAAKVGVLVVNLGTPDAPTAKAVRPYLKQFLSDSRVVEVPKPIWWLILNGIILPIRSGASAKKYASVWKSEGSPLMIHTQAQADLLQTRLERHPEMQQVVVKMAMRYGNPSIQSAMDAFEESGVDRIFVLPLYPQYSAATTASTYDEVFRILKVHRNQASIRTIKHYHDHPKYIEALKLHVEKYWNNHGRPDFAAGDKLVMSFHGVPKRTLDRGDPYHCECHKTGRLLREALGLEPSQAMVSFQSRFGKAEWLKPYTAPLLEQLGKSGTKRLDIFCPGFPADCLETLEEIAMEGKEIFQHAGGGSYQMIDCLNQDPAWIDALEAITIENLAGWVIESTPHPDIEQRLRFVQRVQEQLS